MNSYDGNLDDQEKKVIRRECHAAQRELWEIGQRLGEK
jgi:hypothetical protein